MGRAEAETNVSPRLTQPVIETELGVGSEGILRSNHFAYVCKLAMLFFFADLFNDITQSAGCN